MPDDSTVDEKEPMSQTEELITAQAPTVKKEEKEKKRKRKHAFFGGCIIINPRFMLFIVEIKTTGTGRF